MPKNKKKYAHSAKECAYIAVFVALVLALQLVFAAVPGVEVVTVLFISYAFVFGAKRGMLAATVFSFLRQIIFGFFPVVLVLYLFYFNGLVLVFAHLGGENKKGKICNNVGWLIFYACIATACFSMFDNLLTPLWYGYTLKQTHLYFLASLSFMIPQIFSTAVSVTFLFYPLKRIFSSLKTHL